MLLNCTSFGPLKYGTTTNDKPQSVRQKSAVVFSPMFSQRLGKMRSFLDQDADGDPVNMKQVR
jgi:hypothetical protein